MFQTVVYQKSAVFLLVWIRSLQDIFSPLADEQCATISRRAARRLAARLIVLDH